MKTLRSKLVKTSSVAALLVGLSLGIGLAPTYLKAAGPTNAQDVQLNPPAVGMNTAHIISAASLNPSIIGTAGPKAIMSLYVANSQATAMFLKLHDVAAAPTCGTTPVKETYLIPANTIAPVFLQRDYGDQFTNGIGVCITAGVADTDTANAAVGGIVNIGWR